MNKKIIITSIVVLVIVAALWYFLRDQIGTVQNNEEATSTSDELKTIDSEAENVDIDSEFNAELQNLDAAVAEAQ